jgi:hypothetical protein
VLSSTALLVLTVACQVVGVRTSWGLAAVALASCAVCVALPLGWAVASAA